MVQHVDNWSPKRRWFMEWTQISNTERDKDYKYCKTDEKDQPTNSKGSTNSRLNKYKEKWIPHGVP